MQKRNFSFFFLAGVLAVSLGLSGVVSATSNECVGLYGKNRREFAKNLQVYHRTWHATHKGSDTGFAADHKALHTLIREQRGMFRPSLQPKHCLPGNAHSTSRSSLSRSQSSRSSLRSLTMSSAQTSVSRRSSATSSMPSSSASSSSYSANPNQNAPALGDVSTYAVLAGSTVTNIGQTIVTGDLGVHPGSAVTGFGPGIVTGGAIHAGDSSAMQAQAALTNAYNDLAGRVTDPVSVSGNLGGATLTPGLYRSTSGLEISSGNLTLDANGDANAVFIFQIASTLDVAVGRRVVLSGGAKAENIFWQVGTSANIGSNATFKGSILADQSISLQTGATVEGRLLARIGGVTLQGNTITVPSN